MIMTNELTERQAFDLAFLSHPERWPMAPVCCVKRSVQGESWLCCGVVVGMIPTVFKINIYQLISTSETVDWKTVEKHEYETMRALVLDGWMVD